LRRNDPIKRVSVFHGEAAREKQSIHGVREKERARCGEFAGEILDDRLDLGQFAKKMFYRKSIF